MSTKADPEALELRARPRPVTRLNRRMLIGAILTLIVLILGVTVWSLQPHLRSADVRPELHNVDRIARAEGIDRLPPDYSKVVPPKPAEPAIPQLGRPLPGDLGMQLAAARAPHLRECGFDIGDRIAAQLDARVAPRLQPLRAIAFPDAAHAQAAHVRDLAVDHDRLAMVAGQP